MATNVIPIRSMTGFGAAERTWQKWTVRAEARSVNHAELKLSLSLPSMLRLKENELAKPVQEKVRRGHLYLVLTCTLAEEDVGMLVDKERLRGYMRLLKELACEEQVALHAEVGRLVSLPGIVSTDMLPPELRDALWQQVAATAMEAVDSLVQTREVEGRNLAAHLESVCAAIRRRTHSVESRLGDAVRECQKRLAARVEELLERSSARVDEDSLAREVAILAERSDVSEEIARMGSHLEQFEATLRSAGEPVGRKLEFIAQEMLREANTMAAKLPAGELVKEVIEIKTDVQRLREQTRNVE